MFLWTWKNAITPHDKILVWSNLPQLCIWAKERPLNIETVKIVQMQNICKQLLFTSHALYTFKKPLRARSVNGPAVACGL